MFYVTSVPTQYDFFIQDRRSRFQQHHFAQFSWIKIVFLLILHMKQEQTLSVLYKFIKLTEKYDFDWQISLK